MNNIELANKAVDIAKNYKTLYIMGCFGSPMNSTNKKRYTANHSYNKQSSRTKMINAASSDTFGFDCVCLVKGILWGWKGDKTKTYGGAKYKTNGVPDINQESMIKQCKDVSTNFKNIEVGEFLWMKGHCGIYIGNGLAVEATPKWANKVQITAVGNIGKKSGYNTRTWTKHGKLPYITYVKEETKPDPVELKYKVGDTVTINAVYTSSTSTKKLTPKVKTGKITRIVKGVANPYLLENGNIGWINDNCVVEETKKKEDELPIINNEEVKVENMEVIKQEEPVIEIEQPKETNDEYYKTKEENNPLLWLMEKIVELIRKIFKK